MGLSYQAIQAGVSGISKTLMALYQENERKKQLQEQYRLRRQATDESMRQFNVEQETQVIKERQARSDRLLTSEEKARGQSLDFETDLIKARAAKAEKTAAQKRADDIFMADPNNRYGLYLTGKYKPANDREQQYFDALTGKAEKAGAPAVSKSGEKTPASELKKKLRDEYLNSGKTIKDAGWKTFYQSNAAQFGLDPTDWSFGESPQAGPPEMTAAEEAKLVAAQAPTPTGLNGIDFHNRVVGDARPRRGDTSRVAPQVIPTLEEIEAALVKRGASDSALLRRR